jgi:uncharacterized OsmC-like protein
VACRRSKTSPAGWRLKVKPMLEYRVSARRIDAHGSVASTKEAEVLLDTDIKGRPDAFNPAELFLAAIAACMIKGIERVAPIIQFQFRGVEVRLHGIRQDSPPFMSSITYDLVVDTDEDDRRLDLLQQNVRKYGTISNTVAAATKLEGKIVRAGTV